MGGFLQGLGELAEGGMKGYEFAERMKDKISARKKEGKDQEDKDASMESAKKIAPVRDGAPTLSAGTQFKLPADIAAPQAPTDYTGSMGGLNFMDGAVQKYKDGGMVRKYAGGGLIDAINNAGAGKQSFGGFARFAGPAPIQQEMNPYVEQGGEYGYLEQRPPQAAPLQQATPVAQQVAPVSAPSNLPASNFTLPAGNYGDFSGLAKFATGKQYPQQTAQPLAPATPKTVAPLAQVAPVQQKAFGFGVAPPQAPKSLTPEQQAARALRASQGAKMVGSAPIAQQQFAPSQTAFGGLRRAPIAGFAPSQTAFGGLRMDYQSPFNGGARVGAIPRFADGGLVSMAADPEGVSYKTNMAAGLNDVQPEQDPQATQTAQPAQGGKINWGKTVSLRMNAARDTAIERGNIELAQNYQKLGFKARDDMFKKGLPMAQQVFAQTGDISGYVSLYNDTHDDGYNVVGHNKNDDGTYSLKMQQPDGSVQDMNMSTDDMKQMVYQMSNPAARYAGEMAALTERKKALEKSNLSIAEKNAEPFTVADGAQRHGNKDGGYTTMDKAGNLQYAKPGLDLLVDNQKEDSSVSETELAIRASKGDQSAIKALDLIEGHKAKIAREGRAAPQPREPRRETSDERGYNSWIQKPENKGKGFDDYLERPRAKAQSEQLDSVTTSTETYDGEGNVIKESRTSKVKPQKPNSPKYQEYLDARKAAKGNDAIIKKIDAIARANKVIK